MAQVNPRNSGGKPPITRHPLFPATVALWFGALFGIGSLAIRPTLIEGLIVSAGIDAIVPAVAPPLGATTRILLALAMAAIGGALGSRLARRIATPKPVPVQRKRGAGATSAASTRSSQGSEIRASRRSSLALGANDKAKDDLADRAPLPGSASILDVSQFDLEGFEADESETAEPVAPAYYHRPAASEEPASWTPPADYGRVPKGAQVFQPVADEPEMAVAQAEASEQEASDDFRTADTSPSASDGAPPPFAVPAQQQETTLAETGPAPFAAPADRAPFAAPVDRAPFALPADDSAEPVLTANRDVPVAPEDSFDDGDDAPFERLSDESDDRYEPLPPKARAGSIFNQQPASGLFTQPHNAPVSRVGWEDAAAQAADLQGHAEPAEEPAIAEEPAEQTVHEIAEPEPKPELLPVTEAASERIEQAPLDDLSHVELLERLAMSMRRKRSQAPVQDVVASESASPIEAPEAPEVEEDTAPVVKAPAPPVPTIPDALRPIGLDDDEDGDLPPDFVPPRHFAQTRSEPAGNARPAEAEARTEHVDELEEGYSSLLNLSRPGTGQQRFVRIEEPAPLSDEIEPVVVFPGKEPVTGDGPFARPSAARPASQAADDAADAKGHAPQDNQASAPSSRLDSEETDRALRSALANLQRMSGAA